ncbi:MAG: type II CAAX prenyl endopeptidase Rce1 family protein [Myxococcaceae bacterium]
MNTELPNPEVDAPSVSRAALALVATVVVMLGYLVAIPVQILNIGFGLWFTEVIVFFGLVFALVKFSRRTPREYTGLGAPGIAPVVYGFLLGVVNLFAVVVPLQFLSSSVVSESVKQKFDQSKIFESQSGIDLLLIITGVSIAAPLCEEFFFRGVLQRGLLRGDRHPEGGFRGFGPVVGIVLTGAIFSAFHLDPVGFLARWELGVLFGYLAYRTRSLWPGIAAHAANNLTSSAAYLFSKDQSGAEESWRGILVLVAIGAPLLAGLLFLPKRFGVLLTAKTQQSEKLTPKPRPLFILALPWILGAVVSVAAVIGIDYRGVKLNVIDLVMYPLDALPKNASESQKMEHGALLVIRKKARSGELPVELYESKRKALWDAANHGKKSPFDFGPRPTAGTDGMKPGEHALDVFVPLDADAGEDSATEKTARDFAEALGKKLRDESRGVVDGVEVLRERAIIHAYGKDADAMAQSARETAKSFALPAQTAVSLRRGPSGTEPDAQPLNR